MILLILFFVSSTTHWKISFFKPFIRGLIVRCDVVTGAEGRAREAGFLIPSSDLDRSLDLRRLCLADSGDLTNSLIPACSMPVRLSNSTSSSHREVQRGPPRSADLDNDGEELCFRERSGPCAMSRSRGPLILGPMFNAPVLFFGHGRPSSSPGTTAAWRSPL